jgi:hypothetical protein
VTSSDGDKEDDGLDEVVGNDDVDGADVTVGGGVGRSCRSRCSMPERSRLLPISVGAPESDGTVDGSSDGTSEGTDDGSTVIASTTSKMITLVTVLNSVSHTCWLSLL